MYKNIYIGTSVNVILHYSVYLKICTYYFKFFVLFSVLISVNSLTDIGMLMWSRNCNDAFSLANSFRSRMTSHSSLSPRKHIIKIYLLQIVLCQALSGRILRDLAMKNRCVIEDE